MKKWLFHIFSVVLALWCLRSSAAPVITVTPGNQVVAIDGLVQEYINDGTEANAQYILDSGKFVNNSGSLIYAQFVKDVWLRFTVQNNTTVNTLYFNVTYPNLSHVSLYTVANGNANLASISGNSISHSGISNFAAPNIIFGLKLPAGQAQEYLLHVNSVHPIMVPAFISTEAGLQKAITLQTFIIGAYLGVLLIMLLYNLFLFLATRDDNYLLYAAYLFFLCLVQITA